MSNSDYSFEYSEDNSWSSDSDDSVSVDSCETAISAGGSTMLGTPTKGKVMRVNRKNVGLTYSCPKSEDENPISAVSAISAVVEGYGKCKWVIAKEHHEDGKIHWHAYVIYDKKIDVRGADAFDCCGVHPNINRPDNGWLTYITKDNDFETYNWKIEKPLKLITPDLEWEKEILEIITTEPDDRSIYWYWSRDGGVGKTSFCKYLSAKHDAIPLNGKGSDMLNGVANYKLKKGYCPELVVVPIPKTFDTTYLNYTGIELVKDMYFYSGKYEGTTIVGNCPHVFVFANCEPCFEKLQRDRWIVREIF